MISVLISTRNRSQKVFACLNSIFKNSYKNFEVILIDQSTNDQTEKIALELLTKKFKYIKMRAKGKARALNLALKKHSGETLAFTDDDCLVDKYWLKNIYKSFQENKDIVGIFGKVLPDKPHLHKGKICPCAFSKKKKKVITKPCLHWKNIGYGNNMAFRREVFDKLGGFKEWLGSGSVSLAAVDAEFALRVLLKGDKLLYNPKVKVYHNRWLAKEEFWRQCLFYSCGEVACYGYFAFNGLELGKRVVKDNFIDSYKKLKWGIKSLILFRKRGLWIIRDALIELYFRLRGLLVAFWYSKKRAS